jgi:hypothetical protein
MTPQAEKWMEDRETERMKHFEETVKTLMEKAASKGDKKKGKDKGGDKKDKKDKKEKKDKKDKKEKEAKEAPKPPPKYKSATHFMTVHVPCFDSEDQVDGQGPMRRQQLMECATVCYREFFSRHCIKTM